VFLCVLLRPHLCVSVFFCGQPRAFGKVLSVESLRVAIESVTDTGFASTPYESSASATDAWRRRNI